MTTVRITTTRPIFVRRRAAVPAGHVKIDRLYRRAGEPPFDVRVGLHVPAVEIVPHEEAARLFALRDAAPNPWESVSVEPGDVVELDDDDARVLLGGGQAEEA